MIKAAIFDLDGTLVDTEYLKCISYAESLRQISGQDRPTDDDVMALYHNVIGLARQEVAEYLSLNFAEVFKESSIPEKERTSTLISRRMLIYDQMLTTDSIIRPRIRHQVFGMLLQLISDAIKTALATSTNATQAFKLLRTLDFERLFDVIVTRDDIVNSKPAPDAYLACARQLQVASNECLVIEDSIPGAISALEANMCCILIPQSDKLLGENLLIDKDLRTNTKLYILDNVEKINDTIAHIININK